MRRRRHGRENAAWEVMANLAEVGYRAGRWEAAAGDAREAHEILTETGWSDVLGEVLPVKAAIACAMGETQQARVDGTEALSACERFGDRWNEIKARSALGFLELSLGDHAACHAWLGPLVGLTEDMGLREPGAFPFVPDEVEALVALGELGAAVRLIDRLEEQGNARNRPIALATAARCRGLVAGARRDLPGAEEHFRRALELHDAVQQPFELGRTLLAAGVMQRRMRRWGPARERLLASLAVFEELGAPLWVATASTEVARIGGRAPAPATLTPTEEEVARLVAAGGTNREVAARLFMSVHTVDTHLRRIYRKLGVRVPNRARQEAVNARECVMYPSSSLSSVCASTHRGRGVSDETAHRARSKCGDGVPRRRRACRAGRRAGSGNEWPDRVRSPRPGDG